MNKTNKTINNKENPEHMQTPDVTNMHRSCAIGTMAKEEKNAREREKRNKV